MASLSPSLYKIVNAQGGSDARYRALDDAGRALIDADGRPLGAEPWLYPGMNEWTEGLPGAREMNAEGTGGGGGSFLAGDPMFNQMLQNMKAESVADKASRDAGIKRSFINFGLADFDIAKAAATTGVGDLASILDQATLDAARANQFGVKQRIERGLADRQRENRLSLRQRGGTNATGEHGFLAQRAQTDFDTDMFDSTQKLLDYISGAQSAFAQAEQARKQREFELAMQAAMAAASRSSYGGYRGGYDAPEPAAPAYERFTNPDPYANFLAKVDAGAPITPRDFLNL